MPTRTLPGDVAGQIEALPVSRRRALSRAREDVPDGPPPLSRPVPRPG
jgi:hypothetical protein